MAGKVTVKVLGREKVMAQIAAIAPEATTRLAERQMVLAEDLADRIRARAPSRTGRYRRSIRAARLDEITGGRNKPVGMLASSKDPNATGIFSTQVAGRPATLWRWLEFGTVKTAAQPHVFPTYRQRKPYIRRSMNAVLRRALRAAVKK